MVCSYLVGMKTLQPHGLSFGLDISALDDVDICDFFSKMP